MKKADVQEQLRRRGVPVPPSLVVERSTLHRVPAFLAVNPEFEYFFLRAESEQDTKDLRQVVHARQLHAVLKQITTHDQFSTILVQPRIAVAQSGAAARLHGLVFVEYIRGALVALLRDGVTPSRALWREAELLEVVQSAQEFCYQWNGDTLKKEVEVASPSLDAFSDPLLLAMTLLKERSFVIEWVHDQQGRLFVLDLKLLPRDVLGDAGQLTRAVVTSCFFTLPQRFPRTGEPLMAARFQHAICRDRPLYAEYHSLAQTSRPFVYRTGGVLSHPVVYAMRSNIPVILCPEAYAQISRGYGVSATDDRFSLSTGE